VKRATALRYSDTDEAPVVVSSGEGDVASFIQRAAAMHAVPVVRDAPLADALAELRVGDRIPEALYEAVAAILREIAEKTHE
jgi:type III secretion system FlhB-like substrate exporter